MSQDPHPFEGREERWERVGEVYEEALAVPPSGRAAFLDRACAGEPDVRAEVESLLGAQAGAAVRFGQLGAVARSALSDLGPEALPAPGALVGPYRVGEPLGAGGMGTVVRAFDERLQRPVALKFLRSAPDADARERLLREARTVAALDHPHICAVHAVEVDGERPFLVLGLYEGDTLRGRLQRGPLALADALAVAEQTADALAAAHAAGVVHRDLKPANVLLVGAPEGDDETGRAPGVHVRLLDFGIARRAQAASRTQTGAVMGTPGYMAPEQVRCETAGPAADLWALGALLHEMLTGTRPFAAETAAAEIYNVIEGRPATLRGPAGIPPGVAALTEWLLDKHPDRRPASAAEVRDMLRSLAAGGSGATRTWWARQSWRMRALTALAAIAVLLAAVFAVRTPPPAPASSTVAVMPFTVRGGADLGYLREGLVDLLSTGLDDVGGLRTVDPNAVIGRAGPEPATLPDARRMARQFGAGHFVLGRVTDTGVGFRLDASLYRTDGTEEVRARADAASPDGLLPALDALTRQIVAGRLDDAGRALSGIAARTTESSAALRAYLDGERAMRATQFPAAQNAFARAVRADSSFALAWYRLARAAGWTGADSLNHAATARAVALADALPARTQQALAGYRAFREGRPDDAERAYRTALALGPDDAETWQLLGELLFHYNPYRGRPSDEARAPFEMARSYALDNRELLPHLIELAARRADGAATDSLVDQYAGTEAGLADGAFDALRAWADGDERRAEALDLLRQAGPEATERMLLRTAPAVGDPALARGAATLLAGSVDGERQATGHLVLAMLSARDERWDAAEQHFASARRTDPRREAVLRALVVARPDAPQQMAEQARRDVAAWDPHANAPPAGLAGPSAQRYLLGLLDLRLGHTEQALAAADALALGSATEHDLGRTLRAAAALAAGRPQEALDALRGRGADIPFPVRRQSPLVGGSFARALRAQALRHLGRPDEARRWEASLYDGDDPWGLGFTRSARPLPR